MLAKNVALLFIIEFELTLNIPLIVVVFDVVKPKHLAIMRLWHYNKKKKLNLKYHKAEQTAALFNLVKLEIFNGDENVALFKKDRIRAIISPLIVVLSHNVEKPDTYNDGARTFHYN